MPTIISTELTLESSFVPIRCPIVSIGLPVCAGHGFWICFLPHSEHVLDLSAYFAKAAIALTLPRRQFAP